jgi:hypothetical protein
LGECSTRLASFSAFKYRATYDKVED